MFDQFLPYIPFATMVASGGIAWGVTKQRTFRTEKDIDVLFGSLEHHTKEDHLVHNSMIDRLARIETKLDILLGGK